MHAGDVVSQWQTSTTDIHVPSNTTNTLAAHSPTMRVFSFVPMALAVIAGMTTATATDLPAEAALLQARDTNLGDAPHGVLNEDELRKIEAVFADKIGHLVSRDLEAAGKDDKTNGVLGNALRGFLSDDELKKFDGVFDVVADKIGHLVSRDLETAEKGDMTKGVLGGALDGVLSDDELKKVDGVFDVVADRIGHLISRDLEAADKVPVDPAHVPFDTPKPYLDYNADGNIDSEDLRWRIKDYINGKTDRESFVAWVEEYQQRFKDARKDISPTFLAMLDLLRKVKLDVIPHAHDLNTTKPSKRSPAEDWVVLPPKLDLDGDGDVDISDFFKEYFAVVNRTVDINAFNEWVRAYKAKVKADRPKASASFVAWMKRIREAVERKPEAPVQELDTAKPSKRSLSVDVIADDKNAAKTPPVSIEGLPCECKNVIASVLEPKYAEGMTHEWYAKWNEKYYSKMRWREECFDICVDEAMDRFVTKLKWLRGHEMTLNHTKREEASNEPEPEAEQTENIVPTNMTKVDKNTLLSFREWFAETHRTGEYCTCAMKEKPIPRLWGWVLKLSPNSNKRCAKFCDDVVDKWLKHERCPVIIPGGLHGGRCVFPNDGPKNSTANTPVDKPVDGKPA